MKRTKRALFSGVLLLVVLSMLLFGITSGADAASVVCGKWTIVPAGSMNSSLQAVTALAANDVWAVGWSTGHKYTPTYTEHWDGTQWTTIPSPSIKGQVNELNAVSADASNDVWAVGYYGPLAGTPAQSLLEHWNGTQWSLAARPHVPNTYGTFLEGASALPDGTVWAVGVYYGRGNNGGFNGYMC